MHRIKTQDIKSEACAWIAQLETGDLSEQDLTAFREWMNRSPVHIEEITKMAHLSGEVNIIAHMAGPLQAAAQSLQPIMKPSQRRAFFSFPRLALAIMCMLVSVTFLFDFTETQTKYPFIVTTAVGGYEEILLADGTLIKLNTNSQVEVDYKRTERKIRLLKGEAFFDVSHDPQRPFLVFAQENIVRAVGTAFGVRLTESDLKVVVSDGRVELKELLTYSKATSSSPQTARRESISHTTDIIAVDNIPAVYLDAGQSITVSAGKKKLDVSSITQRDIVREMSWQEGLLDFSNTPLPEVIAEVSRYTDLKIEIVDTELRDLSFGGIIRTGETEALFEALSYSFNIQIEYVNNNLVRLHQIKS